MDRKDREWDRWRVWIGLQSRPNSRHKCREINAGAPFKAPFFIELLGGEKGPKAMDWASSLRGSIMQKYSHVFPNMGSPGMIDQ